MSIESTLRDTLHAYAGEAQRDAGLLDAAVARSRRRRRRRVAAGAGVAVAAIAATALAVPATVGGDPDPIEPAFAGGVGLEPAAYELPEFPFTPGWAPPEAEEWHVQLLNDGQWVGLGGAGGDLSELEQSVRVQTAGEPVLRLMQVDDSGNNWFQTQGSATKITLEGHPDAQAEPVTVRGRAATLYTEEQWEGVVWQHRPDLWVIVHRLAGAATTDDLLRYAEELVEAPASVMPFFTFDWVPVGAELTKLDRSMAWFGLPWTDVHDPLGEADVALLEDAPADLHELGDPVDVGDRDGLLLHEGRLVVFLDGGLMLAVGSIGALQLSREDLIRFAAGVQVSPDASPMRAPALPLDTPPDQSPYN